MTALSETGSLSSEDSLNNRTALWGPVDIAAPILDLRLVARPWGSADSERTVSVAVLVPCQNEERTIAKVVSDFRASIPGATVYVYDNASTDRTAEVARKAGAVVRLSPRPGKGNVLRRMFTEIEASIFVLADGDDTYDAASAPLLIRHLRTHNLDMVVGRRVELEGAASAYRRGHKFGNSFLTRSVHWLFGDVSADILSGFRVLSRRYVKSFPAFSCGFETETEMTVHALELHLPFDELPTLYRDRPSESKSKLRALPDGFKILRFILLLCKDYRPLRFFGLQGILAALGAVVAASLGRGHLHQWTPATFAAAGLSTMAIFCLVTGVVLDSLGRTRREMKRMMYLAVSSQPRVELSMSDVG